MYHKILRGTIIFEVIIILPSILELYGYLMPETKIIQITKYVCFKLIIVLLYFNFFAQVQKTQCLVQFLLKKFSCCSWNKISKFDIGSMNKYISNTIDTCID